MKLAQITAVAVCATLAVAACQKDGITGKKSNMSLRSDGKEQNKMAEVFQKYREENTQKFEISVQEGGKIQTEEGMVIEIKGNSLHNPDGSLAEGMATVSVFVANDKESWVLGNLTTEAVTTPDQAEQGQSPILASAGSFDLDITNQEGQELQTTNPEEEVIVTVPAEMTGSDQVDEEMTIWEGEQSQDQEHDNQWKEDDEKHYEVVGNGYRFTLPMPCDQINLDKRVTDWDDVLKLHVQLPSGYTDANAEVFVFFTGYPNTVASMDAYNPATQMFDEHLGFVNNGQTGNILAIGVHPGTNHLVFQTTPYNATDNGFGEYFVNISTMVPTTTATLTALFPTL